MFHDRTLDHLEEMLDAAVRGEFEERDYDETRLSRLETKWKSFLEASQYSRNHLEQEKERIHRLLSDISHQTKTPIANMKLYAALLQESLEQYLDSQGNYKELAVRNEPSSGWGDGKAGNVLPDPDWKSGQAENEPTGKQEGDSITAGEKTAKIAVGRKKDEQQIFSLLQEISRQTEKLEFLIASLTKMSRLESGIVTVQPKKQRIFPLVEEVTRNLSPKAEKRGITVRQNIPEDSVIMACFDWKWTREALENILDNGIKYSSEQSEIRINAREYEMYTVISVCDHGRGIAQEQIPRIFERFYRAPDVQQEEGVGIGLYLSQEILKKENGYITARSRQGVGTEFRMYLWRGSVMDERQADIEKG